MSTFRLSLLAILFAFIPVALSAQAETAADAYKQAMGLVGQAKYEDACAVMKKAHEREPGNATYARSYMRLAFRAGQIAAFAGRLDEAIAYFAAAQAVKKRETDKVDAERLNIDRFCELARERAQFAAVKPEYVFVIQALYFRNTELKGVVDANGKTVTGKGTMGDGVLSSTAFVQDCLRFYVETLSRGRLSLRFDRTMIETTLTRANIYVRQRKRTMFRPDFSSCGESLGRVVFAERNTADAIFYYFLNPGFDVWPFANGVPAVWVPYTWYGPSRPSLAMPMGSGKPGRGPAVIPAISGMFTTFHEFFHIVERRCGGISPMHAWERGNLERARKYFPDWKPDLNPVWTATEYSWYRYHFLNTVPRRLEMKAAAGGLRPIFRNFSYTTLYPDHTPTWLFAAYTKAIAGIAPEQLRLAEYAAAKARSLLKQKKNDEARKELARALALNPYHFDALRELAALAFARKDYAEAFTYHMTLFRAYPEPGEIFSTALKFRDAKELRKAADIFAVGAALPENAAAYAWWRSRLLAEAGDASGARAALEAVKDHPALKGEPGLVECRKAGASLYSNAKPADEAAPILAKTRRGETLNWRIVPSAEKGFMLIVSDYNWRCLAATGEGTDGKIILETMSDTDGQMWKLEEIAKGMYRIVSRRDGLALAVELRGKDKLLALAQPGDDPLQAWNLEAFK